MMRISVIVYRLQATNVAFSPRKACEYLETSASRRLDSLFIILVSNYSLTSI